MSAVVSPLAASWRRMRYPTGKREHAARWGSKSHASDCLYRIGVYRPEKPSRDVGASVAGLGDVRGFDP